MQSFDEVKAAFLEPTSTLATTVEYHEAILPIVANLVDEMIEKGEDNCEQGHTFRVSLALLKALSLIPQVLEREVMLYFSVFQAPPHLCSFYDVNDCRIFDCAESVLLGLNASNALCDMWEWYDVVPLIRVSDNRVRWYGMKAMGLILGANVVPVDVDTGLVEEYEIIWKEVLAKYQLYRDSLYMEKCEHGEISLRRPDKGRICSADVPGDQANILNKTCHLSGRYISEEGFIVARKGGVDNGNASREDYKFHPTADQKNILKRFVMALSMNSTTIVLDGPPSSGKTEIIDYIANRTGNADSMIRVHLDDQLDSKTLLGGYICTENPGEFIWAPGPIVRALKNGCWLVLENINLASSEVITMVGSMARLGSVEIPSRGESIKSKPGFQLILTSTSFPGRMRDQILERMLFSCCVHLKLGEISLVDQRGILERIYPSLIPLIPRILQIFGLLSNVSSGQKRRQTEDLLKHFDGSICLSDLKNLAGNIDRSLTFRDVIKWADRMIKFHSKALTGMSGLSEDTVGDISKIPLVAREGAFVELADCTCLPASSSMTRKTILDINAILLSLPESVIENYVRLYKPSISFKGDSLQIGRAELQIDTGGEKACLSPSFAQTGAAMRLMERLSVSIINNEPILLVGETGAGKTTVIQEIAKVTGMQFSVVNLSQQTDSSDLIGGFRPRIPGDEIIHAVPEFIELIKDTWIRGDNEDFLSRVLKLAKKRKWSQLLKAYKAAIGKWSGALGEGLRKTSNRGTKRRRKEREDDIMSRWESFIEQVNGLDKASSMMERGFAFGFSEGVLVKAFQQGWWLLLDEINLAPTEVLERVAGILDSSQGWILTERGDEKEIHRHPDFRIFAAMNPATDSGKKSLPPLVRDRFTEFWVDEPSDVEDLITITCHHLGPLAFHVPVESVVRLYMALKHKSMSTFQDGSGIRPVYNLRTLTRALEYARKMSDTYGTKRSLIDGFAMSFQTQLDGPSCAEFGNLVTLHLLADGTSLQSIMKASPVCPSPMHIRFDDFWVEGGDQESVHDDAFIITPTVMGYLRNLARAVLLKRYPILLQGPTSSGKTSLISYLAAATGHRCIRINNHEHTDIQDYIGSYMNDSQGRLVFNEGPLVQALRCGYWIILDELNLAPSEVLEALNRLLDDNRELFVPELQENIVPHKHFMLFATQNPPGVYAGRKTLSRAFRSRFLEIHVDDIPDEELHEIIEKKCLIAPSYSKRMISVMRELQRRRSVSNVFAGKHGYITPRDLFRWANRPALGYQDIAINGYFVLGERLRDDSDREVVSSTLEKILKTEIPHSELYQKIDNARSGDRKIVWTPSFQRVFCLIYHCLKNNEPALLIGETGIGKTTACQLLAENRNQSLHILNCNHQTETSDFIGGYRPNRQRGVICRRLRKEAAKFSIPIASIRGDGHFIDAFSRHIRENSDSIEEALLQNWLVQIATFNSPFEWIDGPLVQAMKNGDIILIDEINLAEDAVLERLNSVLESSKIITLAEKSGPSIETVVAHPNFQIVATMNPGGDFGKKELSPALMNRFTSFWVPPLRSGDELLAILINRLNEELHDLSRVIVDLWDYFESNIAGAARQNLSVRDMICLVDFVNLMFSLGLEKLSCLVHGTEMVVIDGLGLGAGLEDSMIEDLQSRLRYALKCILEQRNLVMPKVDVCLLERSEDRWGISPFFIIASGFEAGDYNFETETARQNLFRILRAMQLSRPILLEGSPGVGKTTLVEAMCKAVGQRFVRINLSDQTDMMDLLGANLPSPDGSVGEFIWTDGPLLEAMKSGAWVLLDELNLANQSILEGLNALLDHRGEIYVPELDTVVTCKPGFRLFGAQNPIHEGGGRKGLPRSFLNRFVRVRVRGFSSTDLINISGSKYPKLPRSIVTSLTACILECSSKPSYDRQEGVDFNLRDLLRWCKLVDRKVQSAKRSGILQDSLRWARFYGTMLLSSRMRSFSDYEWMEHILDSNIAGDSSFKSDCVFELDQGNITIGNASFVRKSWYEQINDPPLRVPRKHTLLRSFFHVQEILLECARNGWLGILVGDAGSGKSSCILDVASMIGKKIVQIQVHEGTDISDLLGGFEQVDLIREGTNLTERISKMLQHAAILSIYEDEAVAELKVLAQRLFSDKSQVDLNRLKFIVQGTLDNIVPLSDLIRRCENRCLTEEFSRVQRDSEKFLRRSSVAGKFEWVDGTLTKCIINGCWVILRDANLCNPSVLDRLNPLFEPGGFISLNECGSTQEGPRMVVPHTEFRLFITYDPINGEISRAMKNRGIEVNISWGNSGKDVSQGISGTLSVLDLVGFVGNASIPKTVSDYLVKIWMSGCIPGKRKTLQYLSNWSNITHNLVCQGISLSEAVSVSYEQTFNYQIPSEFLNVENIRNVEGDPSTFMYPGISDICQASGLDRILSDWAFLIQNCQPFGTSKDSEIMTVLEERGAFVALLFSHLVTLDTNDGTNGQCQEDSVNAAMAIFAGNGEISQRAEFILQTIRRMPSGRKGLGGLFCRELNVWEMLFSELLETQMGTGMHSHSTRFLLEKFRMKVILSDLPGNIEQCGTVLEATAWCFDRPFSQEFEASDALLMKWIWAALTSLYDLHFDYLVQESHDNLSYIRRVLMSQEADYNKEVLTHAWRRLAKSLDGASSIHNHALPEHVQQLVQKVSSLLTGDEQEHPMGKKFLEAVGQPMVALNLEFHRILTKARSIANQASICQDDLIRYRTDESSKISNCMLKAVQPSVRMKLLRTLKIFLAGSLLDANSTLQLKEMLIQLSDLMDHVEKDLESRVLSSNVNILSFDTAFEQQESLNDIILRQMEVCFVMENAWQYISCGYFDFQTVLSKTDDILKLTAALPSRKISEALPFQAFSDYGCVLMEETASKGKTNAQKGISMMALLQMHKNIWLPYLISDCRYTKPGALPLHACAVSAAVAKIATKNERPSLKHQKSRLYQIERCVESIIISRGSGEQLELLEWRSALILLFMIINCILDDHSKIPTLGDISTKELRCHLETYSDEILSEIDSIQGIDRDIINGLKQSFHLLVFDERVMLRDGLLQRGKALSLLCLAQLCLSKPCSPFDPSLAGEMERKALDHIIEHFYENLIQTRNVYSSLPMSTSQTAEICRLERQLKILEKKKGEISETTSARPEVSQYLTMKDEINAYISHLVSASRITKILEDLEDFDSKESACSQASLWIENTNGFIESINTKFPCYRDIFGQLELSLRGMQYGISLMLASASMSGHCSKKLNLVQSLITAKFSHNCVLLDSHLDTTVDKNITKGSDDVLFRLKLCDVYLGRLEEKLATSTCTKQKANLYTVFESIGEQVHEIWEHVREEEKARLEEEQSLFEIKARQLHMTREEVSTKAELDALFEDEYSQYYDIDERGIRPEITRDAENVETKQHSQRNSDMDIVLSKLVSVFYALNGDSGEKSKNQRYDNDPFWLGVTMMQQSDGLFPRSLDQQSMPGFLLSLCQEHAELAHLTDCDLCHTVHSPNILEASRLQKPLETILSKINALLDEWPEHPILEQLSKIGHKILNLPLASPLKAFLTGIELMLNRAQIWEETAAKHVTLTECLKPFVSIATSWRKLELNGWKGLLITVRDDARKQAFHSWFHIFGIINTKVESMTEFINVIDSFIRDSSVGQFDERLKILRVFAVHLVNSPRPDYLRNQDIAISNSLSNLARYYSQFENQIHDYVKREMGPLEKDLSDFVSLAKWEDKGFYAMKASSEKSHSHLYRILRKAKDVLERPCHPCLAEAAQNIAINSRGDDTGSKTKLLIDSLPNYLIQLNSKVSQVVNIDLGKYSGRLDKVLMKFEKMVQDKCGTLERVDRVAGSIDALACSAMIQADQLKQDTDKGAKSRKKKAFSDLLKALENCGVSKLQTSIPAASRNTHHWIAQPIPCPDINCFSGLGHNVDKNATWDIGDQYYFKSVSRLKRLDQICTRPHLDIQQREIQISNNLAKHSLFILQRIRSTMCHLLNVFDDLERSIHAMTSARHVSATRDSIYYDGLQEAISSCMLMNAKFVKYLDTLSRSGNQSLPLDRIQCLSKLLEESQAFLAPLRDTLAQERAKTVEFDGADFFVTQNMENFFEECQSSIIRVSQSIVDSCSDVPGCEFLLQVYQELSAAVSDQNVIAAKQVEITSKGELSTVYEDLVRACMVWAQSVPSCDINNEDITVVLPEIERTLNVSTIQTISDRSIQVIYLIDSMIKGGSPYLNDAGSMASNVLPVLESTRESMKHFILRVSVLHRSMAKLSYISLGIFCELFEKGFCAQTDQEAGEEEQTKDGTGLGEGDTSGAKDISDQLENQDQILGAQFDHQAEGEEEENICDENNEAQGIEMDEDFEGAMDNVDRLEGEEEDDENENEDQQLDQQIGDTDGADAVDEKVWDKEDEESSDREVQDKSKSKADVSSLDYAKGDVESDHSEPEEEIDHAMDQGPEGGPKGDVESEHSEPEEEMDHATDQGPEEKMERQTEAEGEDTMDQGPEENIEDQTEAEGEDAMDQGPEEKIEHQGDAEEEGEEDYGENIDTSFKEHENSCEDMDLPEDMNLDDVDMNQEGTPEGDENFSEEDNMLLGENHNPDSEKQEDEMMKESEMLEEDTMQDDVKNEKNVGDSQEKTGVGQTENNEDKSSDDMDRDRDTRGNPDTMGAAGEDPIDKGGEIEQAKEDKISETNPFRSVQDAVEQWKIQNAIDLEQAEEHEHAEMPNQSDPGHEQELRFVHQDEIEQEGDDQILADATEDQAQHGIQNEEDVSNEELGKRDEVEDTMMDQQKPDEDPHEGTQAQKQDDTSTKNDPTKVLEEKESTPQDMTGEKETRVNFDTLAFGSLSLSEQRQDSLRANIDKRIQMIDSDNVCSDIEYGREVWNNCELLTAHLSSELAEQIRLILEPTTASKLGGEYRSGKRINMKRVIGYIASHFKKDKIWMRRTQPDKRRYQVLVAIDDSRSMAETACGAFALESLTLICNSMSKIEIGDFGVVRFGASVGAELVHPLGQSFSPGDGAKIMSKMRFDSDNTINDRPMVDLLGSIDSILEQQSMKMSHSAAIQQLVIILADGRFHEKDDLKKVAMDVTSKPGVMYAYIVLDSPQNSILDMQSVSFGGDGKPVFNKYIDSFPFPLYTVVQDIHHLPKALSHLLRQWIEFTSSSSSL